MTDVPRSAAVLNVTIFGDHDAIGQAISDEFGRRGCRTHSVSVETGWLASTTNAVVRVDTAAGASALEGLTVAEGPGVHVVAVHEGLDATRDSNRLRHLCEECGSTHEVCLLSHPPIPMASGLEATDPPVRHLALAVVDELAQHGHESALPSFSTRSVAV